MINKLYEKLKKYIKNNYKLLITFIFVIVCLTTPLPYYIYTGGGTINVSDRVNIKNNKYKEEGSFNLAYVEELRATILTYLLSYIMPDWKVESIASYTVDDSEDTNDVMTRDRLYLENANSSAIKVAYTLANKEFKVTKVYNNVIYVSDEAETSIKVGDIITKIEGKTIKDVNELKEYIQNQEIGTKINVTIKRKNKELDSYIYVRSINGEKLTGLSILTTYDYDTDPAIDMKFKTTESGSSGGFTTALSIYNKLVKEDITHGLKIVGTGTIDDNGNVGEIGGVTYKLKGAVKSKADIFFVPKGSNYEEAKAFKKKKNYDIKIVAVDNIKDAIEYLNKLD